jgi:photosystem II stability/assembly factor-like uncharacterized protein
MVRSAALALTLLVAACAPSPSAAPTSTATLPAATPTLSATATVAPSPTPTPISLPSFAQLSAPAGSVVWALVAGTRLFRSTDRGDAWTERPLPAQARNPDISFVTDSEGWLAMNATPAAQCVTQSVSLAHTANAGTAWQDVAPTGIAPPQCKENLSFIDAQRGFISAWDPNGPPVIYRSVDGGKTWTASKALADPPGFTTSNAGFTLRAGAVKPFGSALLVEAVGQTTGGQRRFVFGSSDAGATWVFRAAATDPESGVVFVTATRWLQISTPGASKETTDGGATWHAFTTDYQQAAPIAPSIVFGDTQVGYATVRGAIQRTTDGGGHWIQIRTPGTF